MWISRYWTCFRILRVTSIGWTKSTFQYFYYLFMLIIVCLLQNYLSKKQPFSSGLFLTSHILHFLLIESIFIWELDPLKASGIMSYKLLILSFLPLKKGKVKHVFVFWVLLVFICCLPWLLPSQLLASALTHYQQFITKIKHKYIVNTWITVNMCLHDLITAFMSL